MAKKTIVFIPMDSHGHTNAMLSLAEELKSLDYRTVFITNTTETPKLYGHELILIEGQQEIRQSTDATCEEDAFLGATLFDQDWDDDSQINFDVDMANDSEWDEISSKSTENNFKLWPYFWRKSGETDPALERLLVEIGPDLVVTESMPMRPALIRLADKSYAYEVAGWNNGLRWMQLSSFGPLWSYYFADMASRQRSNESTDANVASSELLAPPPLLGLPIRLRLNKEDYLIQSDRFKAMLESGGLIKSAVDLGRLALMENLDSGSLSDSQIGRLLLNESEWLNVFMYPEELDYEQDFENKLDKSRWLRVDSLVRPTSFCSRPLDSISQQLLADLASWRESARFDTMYKIIYVSLGTVISENLDIMFRLMHQVFVCLINRKQWHFAVSLVKKRTQICSKFCDELAHWQGVERRLIVKGWWPQPEVFKRQLADACVVHGGNNTICELFQFSPLPAMVVVPGVSDQLDNARRLEELGLGTALPVGRLIRANPRGNSKTMLLDALDRAFKLQASKREQPDSRLDGTRRDASHCAQLISAKLEEECSNSV